MASRKFTRVSRRHPVRGGISPILFFLFLIICGTARATLGGADEFAVDWDDNPAILAQLDAASAAAHQADLDPADNVGPPANDLASNVEELEDGLRGDRRLLPLRVLRCSKCFGRCCPGRRPTQCRRRLGPGCTSSSATHLEPHTAGTGALHSQQPSCHRRW